MNIAIHLSNHLVSEAVYQLLVGNGYDHVVTSESPPPNGFTPDVLLVDIATLTQDLLVQHPEAKILLIDTGIEQDKLCATLLSYRIHGILSPDTELHLFKKALKMVTKGRFGSRTAPSRQFFTTEALCLREGPSAPSAAGNRRLSTAFARG